MLLMGHMSRAKLERYRHIRMAGTARGRDILEYRG
jgi:hypothetical protein